MSDRGRMLAKASATSSALLALEAEADVLSASVLIVSSLVPA